jgi:hypothetical protein
MTATSLVLGPIAGDHIDTVGGPRTDDDFLLGTRVQKRSYDAVHIFALLGGKVTQVVQTAMIICILFRITTGYSINHYLWF